MSTFPCFFWVVIFVFFTNLHENIYNSMYTKYSVLYCTGTHSHTASLPSPPLARLSSSDGILCTSTGPDPTFGACSGQELYRKSHVTVDWTSRPIFVVANANTNDDATPLPQPHSNSHSAAPTSSTGPSVPSAAALSAAPNTISQQDVDGDGFDKEEGGQNDGGKGSPAFAKASTPSGKLSLAQLVSSLRVTREEQDKGTRDEEEQEQEQEEKTTTTTRTTAQQETSTSTRREEEEASQVQGMNGDMTAGYNGNGIQDSSERTIGNSEANGSGSRGVGEETDTVTNILDRSNRFASNTQISTSTEQRNVIMEHFAMVHRAHNSASSQNAHNTLDSLEGDVGFFNSLIELFGEAVIGEDLVVNNAGDFAYLQWQRVEEILQPDGSSKKYVELLRGEGRGHINTMLLITRLNYTEDLIHICSFSCGVVKYKSCDCV